MAEENEKEDGPDELLFKDIIGEYAYTVIPRKSPNKSSREATARRKHEREASITGSTREVRRFAIRNPVAMYLLLACAGFVFISIVKHYDPSDIKDLSTYIAAIGVPVAIYQLWMNSVNKQAEKINAIFSTLYEKSDLYKAWYYLFYDYNNTKFAVIHNLIKELTAANKTTGKGPKFDISFETEEIRKLNEGRPDGGRFWHPKIIAKSPEEASVDQVLGYVNLIGDLYERGFLSIGEIGDAAEYYLLAIGNSNAFRAYIYELRKAFSGEPPYTPDADNMSEEKLNSCRRRENKEGPREGVQERNREPTRFRRKFGVPPYRHLCLLLHDLDRARAKKEELIYGRFDVIAYEDKSDVDGRNAGGNNLVRDTAGGCSPN